MEEPANVDQAGEDEEQGEENRSATDEIVVANVAKAADSAVCSKPRSSLIKMKNMSAHTF